MEGGGGACRPVAHSWQLKSASPFGPSRTPHSLTKAHKPTAMLLRGFPPPTEALHNPRAAARRPLHQRAHAHHRSKPGSRTARPAGAPAHRSHAATGPAAADAADGPQPAASTPTPSRPPSLLARAALQVLVLAAALAGLILLPAHLSGRLAAQPGRTAASYALYLLFFASGTISRMVKHGRLASARQDRQRSSSGARAALLAFAAGAVPAGHFAAWWDGSGAALAAAAPAAAWLLPAAGYACMLGSWALNAAAAAALGKVRLQGGGKARNCIGRLLLPGHALMSFTPAPALCRPTTAWLRLKSW